MGLNSSTVMSGRSCRNSGESRYFANLAGKKREENTLLHCLSHNSPCNPPQNKRILDAEEERKNGALSELARGESVIKC